MYKGASSEVKKIEKETRDGSDLLKVWFKWNKPDKSKKLNIDNFDFG